MDVGLGEPVFFTALQTGVKVRASKLIVLGASLSRTIRRARWRWGPGARLIFRGLLQAVHADWWCLAQQAFWLQPGNKISSPRIFSICAFCSLTCLCNFLVASRPVG